MKYLFWRRMLAWCMAVVTGLALIYALVFPAQIRCALIGWTDFVQPWPGVYADTTIPMADTDSLRPVLERARRRVEAFWGRPVRVPVVIVAGTSDALRRLGADPRRPGMHHATPWGPYIVLSPAGIHEDVIAHELCHAALLESVGWYARTFEVPVWFDEGLAMLLDGRFGEMADEEWRMLTRDGQYAPPLDHLRRMRDFEAVGRLSPYLSYLTAKREVARWYQSAGQQGLHALCGQLREGQDFDTAYRITADSTARP